MSLSEFPDSSGREQAELLIRLSKKVTDLNHRLDTQQELLARLLDLKDSFADAFCDHGRLGVVCAREERLSRAVQEAICVLEQTRKSFRSKQLEVLRVKLVKSLAGFEE
ncbi:hypothetical protein [Desulfonatronovibrio hydrogenovorans]|uniref:hypothetical protein n=1 Tax=Desulfonatronovibrio hydrogenovorans TaxID=53245 RepID=UPI00048FA096|nr:hypothetical protein [Desulfonatronovibrio hydrogenovorans]